MAYILVYTMASNTGIYLLYPTMGDKSEWYYLTRLVDQFRGIYVVYVLYVLFVVYVVYVVCVVYK